MEKLTELIDAARQGSVEAMYELGMIYYSGEGVPENVKLAMKWLKKAADNGDTFSKELYNQWYKSNSNNRIEEQQENEFLSEEVARKHCNTVYMKSISNITNIQEKLHIDEHVIRAVYGNQLDVEFNLREEDVSLIENTINKLTRWVDFNEMVTKLLKCDFYGSAFNYIDYSTCENKNIYRVNIGCFNRDIDKVVEIAVLPHVSIYILTELAVHIIQEHPKQERAVKDSFVRLISEIAKRKFVNSKESVVKPKMDADYTSDDDENNNERH